MAELNVLKEEAKRAKDAYEQLLAGEYVNVFELDGSLMESYEAQTKYIRALERRIIELED